MRRRPDGTFEEIDWDTAITEIAEALAAIAMPTAATKIFYYGGGQAGGPSRWRLQRCIPQGHRIPLPVQRTGPGEDEEAWVDAHLYAGHTRGEFEHAEVAVFVGRPVDVAELPRARMLNEIATRPGHSR
jgi:formate dehydrogenase